jgi:hypothetical protein
MKSWTVAVTVLFVLALVIFGFMCASPLSGRWTSWGVKSEVEKYCGPGSSRIQVASFLNERQWAWSATPPGALPYLAQEAHIDLSTVSEVIVSEVPGALVDPIDSGDITVYIFLDSRGAVISTYVRVYIRGL